MCTEVYMHTTFTSCAMLVLHGLLDDTTECPHSEADISFK